MIIETSEQQSTRLCRHLDGCTDQPPRAALYALPGRKPSFAPLGPLLVELAIIALETIRRDNEGPTKEWLLAVTDLGIERFTSVGEQWPDLNTPKIIHASPAVTFHPTPDWFEVHIDGIRFCIKPRHERFARSALAQWTTP